MFKKIVGFEHVKKFKDNKLDKAVAKVLPGEYYITREDEWISTILGSCVSACIRDKIARLGGINHFMLPLDKGAEVDKFSTATRYGNWAMEHLINDVLKYGTGKRENLEIKVFGGGAVLQNFTQNNIGEKNIQFVLRYLNQEQMKILSQDLGGTHPRKIMYHPKTGEALVKKLTEKTDEQIAREESAYLKSLKTKPVDGDVELF